MCGICAIIETGPTSRSIGLIEIMLNSISHRGPDGSSIKILHGCCMGHSRLSIIDLSTGTQPMSYAQDRYWITFNGEIYNYLALRAILEGMGHIFMTTSDTEVILASYSQWGEKCLDHFRGMFAFAVWDENERRLFAARDLFGEKPLYYAFTPDHGLVLASEIRAIIASGMVEPKVDLNAVDAYLAIGYIPPNRTIYSNVFTLPPGHYLELKQSNLKVVRYWRPIFKTQPITLIEAEEKLRGLLRQAVNRQMVADVPVGAFLSGGLDSSTIVALMQMQSERPVKTFSVGFGSYINELPYASAVAKKYGTEHHEINLGTPNVADMLLAMAEVYDEPFFDTSNIPSYLISKFARQHVKVVLSGDGGDELFGGYSWTYPMLVRSGTVPDSMALWILLRSISKLVRHSWKSLALYSAGCGLAARWPDMRTRQFMQQTYIRDHERKRLWDKRSRDIESYFPDDYYSLPNADEGANQGFYYDLTSYLPGDILVKVDRASMAHGLETRAPFLDRDVAEFALSLPVNLKVDGWETKIVLQKACEQFWPKELHGRKKQGFGSPIHVWATFKGVRDLIDHVFAKNSRLSRLLPGVIHSEDSGKIFENWILLVLGLWLERNSVNV